MPIIKPISDLRKKSKLISELAHRADGPIFIAKNGKVDMVVMSLESYAAMRRKLDLYSKLLVAQHQKARGDRGRKLSGVLADIRKKIHELG